MVVWTVSVDGQNLGRHRLTIYNIMIVNQPRAKPEGMSHCFFVFHSKTEAILTHVYKFYIAGGLPEGVNACEESFSSFRAVSR